MGNAEYKVGAADIDTAGYKAAGAGNGETADSPQLPGPDGDDSTLVNTLDGGAAEPQTPYNSGIPKTVTVVA